MEERKDYKEIIESFIYDYPVCEFYYLTPDDLIFSDKVRFICENGCTHYNKSWACPPVIEPVDKCIGLCRQYGHVFLFSTANEVSDSMNMSACVEAKNQHEQVTLRLRDEFRRRFGDVLALSTGCMLCAECSYPDAPCRRPDDRLSTIESHGILIMETASRLGACYDCTENTVIYFSLLFFNA